MKAPALKKWKVLERKSLTYDVIELVIERAAGTEFRAGQYMSIVIPEAGPGGRNLRRAYSIASPPEQETIELCIKLVPEGPGTTYLASLQPGHEFEAQMPFGEFVLDHDLSLPTLFIATGTGVAPHRAMVLSKATKLTGPVGFLLGVRTENDILYPELFGPKRVALLRDQPHVKISLSKPSAGWTGPSGRVTDYLRDMSWEFRRSHYYLCGNGQMISDVKHFLIEHKGVTKEQIHTEKYY